MFNKIRWRIAVPYVILFIVLFIGLGIYLTNFIRQTYLQNIENELVSEARLAADALAPVISSAINQPAINTDANRWARILGRRVTIIQADGTVLGESSEDPQQLENHLTRPEIQQALQEGQGSSIRYSFTVKMDLMYAAVPIKINDQVVGFIRLALPLYQVQDKVTQLQRVILGTLVTASLLAIVMAAWIAGRTTKPLSELTEAATRISHGDLSQTRLAIRVSTDEVGQLTQAFNLMSEQLHHHINALESERSKIAAVLNEMTDGVVIADAEGKVQLLNPAAESMFEVHQEQALGRTLIEVFRHHQIIDLWQRFQETQEPQTIVIEIGLRQLYLQGVAIPLGKALPGSVLLLFQNLTRLRRLETVRRDFISNISHELRTPLASLKALTETLQESALEDPPTARRFLQRMETEVDALSLMVSELVELSRIESGQVPLKMAPTRPADLLENAVERLRLQAERAGLVIAIDCPADLPNVLADSSRMEQVLVNLLHNAIKFTPEGGKISVNARSQAEQVIFTVQDTGIGIPASDLPRIFERFYKADRARSGGGTGLGLAIARHLVEAHQGKIWAESREGKGSTFYFSLPLVT